MTTARAVMTPWTITATKEMPLADAIDLMLGHWISGLPVIDDDKKVIGVVTEKDILRLYDKAEQIKNMTVGDIMTKQVVCFNEDDSLDVICSCLKENDFRRVPVLSDGKLVGIIGRADITRGILNKIRAQTIKV